MFQDKVIVCKDCGQEFTFTASEQEFFAEKGFTNEPQRCKPCRMARKGNSSNGSGRQMHTMPSAAPAALPARFLSNHAMTVLSIAAIATVDNF